MNTPAPWSQSPTIVTSSTMWLAGFWNWTGAAASPSKATTHNGWKPEKRLQQEKAEASRQKAIKSELEWVRSNAKGRHARARPAYHALTNWPREFQKRNETNDLHPTRPRLGDIVFELNDVSKRFGDKLLFEHLSFNVPPGSIVGVIGGNGAGKSTLFKLLAGMEQPDAGDIRIGDTVKLSHVGQMRELDDSKTAWEEVSNGQDIIQVGSFSTPSRAYLGPSTSAEPISRNAWATCREESAIACFLAKLLQQGAMSCYSMNRPTTSMLKPFGQLLKRVCLPSLAAPL